MNLFKKDREKSIIKSKEIIQKEKEKIKEERKKMKQEKKKNHLSNDTASFQKKETKKKILMMIYFEILGAVICLLVLFLLSGGKNFIKLYSDLQKVINVYDTITKDYYGKVDKKKLVDQAVEAMLTEAGDSYTTYSNKKDTTNFLETVNGTYEGIGCMISMDNDNNIVVISVFDDGPAKKAGLQEKDIITQVDGKDYSNKTSNDLSEYVKNRKKNTVELTIKRGNDLKKITIKRNRVEVPSVTSKVIEQETKKIGYIDISVFSSVTYEQFKNQLTSLEKKGIQALIIDVRNDSGGYLNSVTDISSLFLKKGKVIYQLQDSNKTEVIKDKTKEYRSYPIAVLVNAASASASEILASAIKESYGGLVVGTKTYGKGTVQKTKKLSDGTMIKYTIEKWLTPKGNWINKEGVEPTNPVAYEVKDGHDLQLQTATDLLVNQIKK